MHARTGNDHIVDVLKVTKDGLTDLFSKVPVRHIVAWIEIYPSNINNISIGGLWERELITKSWA